MKKLVVPAIVVLAGIAAWFLLAGRNSPKRSVEVRGTITFVDAAAGIGSIEYRSPQTGEAVEVSARVGPGVAITLNGAPAKLGDLRPGDEAVVKAEIQRQRTEAGKTREITATNIEAMRSTPETAKSGSELDTK
ncbi:MAG: hypothetical protein J5J06_01490 [Phycisphaerae bacterium]|nr:hypothetical protein [Phycisphaerae bacterium]